MMRDGKNLSEIARALGRDKGTISREIKRNSSPKQNYYTMPWAHQKAERRSWRAHRRPRLKNEEITLYVRSKLKEGWSPEQISGRIGQDCPGLSISHEAIYQYIYSLGRKRCKEFSVHLRCKHPRRWKKNMGRKCRKPKIINRISIEKRPAAVETKSYPALSAVGTSIAERCGKGARMHGAAKRAFIRFAVVFIVADLFG